MKYIVGKGETAHKENILLVLHFYEELSKAVCVRETVDDSELLSTSRHQLTNQLIQI